jgi:cold shock protein
MAAGSLKMWNADRGFGFIKDDSGGPDIFMHISALQGINPDNLRLGERLTFDVERDALSGIKAENVRQPGRR